MTRRTRRLALASGAVLLLAGAGYYLRGSEAGPRVLLVGLDGADWRILRPLLDRGEMPHLASLIERGASGPLRSIEPLISPPIWTSIATGVKPERHGITWFLCDTDRPGERVPVTSALRKAKAFWNVLSEHGTSVGVVGWWATFPAERVRGFLVSDFVGFHGFGNSGRGVETALGKTHPPSLLDAIEAALPDPNRVGLEEARRFLAIGEEELAEARRGEGRHAESIPLFLTYLATADAYARIAEIAYRKHPTDLLAVYFELPDATSHLFARYAPPKTSAVSEEGFARFSTTVEEAYRHQDELLGRLIRLVGESAAIFVVSDHGFRWGERRPREGDRVEVGKAHLWHEREGILVAAGPGIRSGSRIEKASVLDVAPTLLRYLGAPVARDLDGGVLVDLFEPEWLEANPPPEVDSYGEGGGARRLAEASAEFARGVEEEQTRRLAALGYLSVDASSAEMRRGRTSLLVREEKWEEAEEEARSLVRKTPSDAGARILLAEILRRTRRLALAREQYEAAYSLAPDHPGVLLGLGEVVADLGDLPTAEAWLREALERGGDSPRGRLDLGHVLHLQRRPAEAKEEFEAALALDPRSPAALYNLGVIEQESGHPLEAAGFYRRAIEASAGEVRARMNLAVILSGRGEAERAIALLAEASRLSPEDADIRYNLGTLYLGAGMTQSAVEELEAAVRLDPDLREAHFNLGRAFVSRGSPLEAIRAFEVAARLERRDPESRYAIAVVEASIGREERARAALEAALAAGGESIRKRAAAEPALRSFLTPR